MVCEIFQKKISSETGRAGIENFRVICILHKFYDRVKIFIAIFENNIFMRVIAVRRPVEDDQGGVAVPFEYFLREELSSSVIFVPRKTMAEYDDTLERGRNGRLAVFLLQNPLSGRAEIYFTPYVKICTREIKIFFHIAISFGSGPGICIHFPRCFIAYV